MRTRLMAARIFVILGLMAYVVSLATPWVYVSIKVGNEKEEGTGTIWDLFGRDIEGLGWVKWTIAGSILVTLFGVMAVIASFYTISHPHMFPIMCALVTVIGICVFAVYIPNSGKKYEVSFKFLGDLWTLYSDPFITGFVFSVVGTVFFFLATLMAMGAQRTMTGSPDMM